MACPDATPTNPSTEPGHKSEDCGDRNLPGPKPSIEVRAQAMSAALATRSIDDSLTRGRVGHQLG